MAARKKSNSSLLHEKHLHRIHEIHEFAETNHTTQPESVVEMLDEAVRLAEIINDVPLLLKSMGRRAYGLRILLKMDEALCLMNKALAIAVRNGLKEEVAKIHNNLANYYYALGKHDEARVFYLRNKDFYGESGNYILYVTSLADAALMSTLEGKLTEALQYCQKAFAICEDKNIAYPVNLLHNTANIYANVGEIQRALEYYFAALEIAEQTANISHQAMILGAIGLVYQENGNPEQALEYSFKALELHRNINHPAERIYILAIIADNLLAVDRLDEASDYLEQAWDIGKGKKLRSKELSLSMVCAALNIKRQNFAKALEFLNNALEIAEELHSTRDKVTILLEKGKIERKEIREEILNSALMIAKSIGWKTKIPDIYYALYEYYEQSANVQAALDNFRLFHTLKHEIHGEEAIRRMQVIQVQHDAEKARNELRLIRLEKEKLEQESFFNQQQLKELTADLIQKNQVLSQIKQDSLEALRQHGLKQKRKLQNVIKTAEEGATAFWQQLEERTKRVEGNFTEKMKKICPELTPIELRILLLLKTGMSNKEIAQILFIMERTIEYHRTSIRKKLQLGRSGNLITYINSL